MINVLEFHYSVGVPGTVYINVTANFTSGSYVAFSTTPMTSELSSTAPALSMSLSTDGNYHIAMSGSGTDYLGFYLPPGSYSGDMASFSISYVAS